MTTTRRLALLAVAALLVATVVVLAFLRKSHSGEAVLGSRTVLPGQSAVVEPTEGLDRVAAEIAGSIDSEAWTFEPEELASIAAQSFEGTRIQVLIDGVPASTGWVDVYEKVREADGSTHYASTDPRTEPIGQDGIASFAGVGLAHLDIDVRLPGGEPMRTGADRRRDPDRVVVVNLGTAQIFGRVWRPDGQPATGVGVSASLGQGSVRTRCTTDSTGQFAFRHLPAGKFQVSTTFGQLAPGEVRNVELGRPGGLVTVQGRLLDAVGNQVTDVRSTSNSIGRLEFVAQGATDREVYATNVSGSGDYRVGLPRATFVVRLLLQGSYHLEHELHAALEVTTDATVDFTIPGARVSGLAYVEGSVHRFDPEYDGKWAKLLLTNSQGPAYAHDALVGRDGRYVFHGIGPGTWQLSGQRVAESTEIVVGPDDRNVVLDVILRPPVKR